MGDMIASIGQDGTVELVDERMVKIAGADPMTPADAALLARSLLSCAALLTLDSPQIGAIFTDLHFSTLKWVVTAQTETRKPLVIFSISPGIDLTFQMSSQVEKEIGAALVAHAEGNPPPERPPDMIH